eukprot:15473843-Alexandrium_andersonii.AAC.1
MLADVGAVKHLADGFPDSGLPGCLSCTGKVSLAAEGSAPPVAPGGRAPGFTKTMLACRLIF